MRPLKIVLILRDRMDIGRLTVDNGLTMDNGYWESGIIPDSQHTVGCTI